MSAPQRPIRVGALVVAAIVGVLAGCSVGPPSADRTTVPSASDGAAGSVPPPPSLATPDTVPTATIPPTPTESPTDPSDGPPVARLAAEGGDPVEGDLGTYLWADGGSDSPWLPGAPMTVGAGEPLVLTLDPATAIVTWRARIVEAGQTGPAGATVLAEGSGPPRFAAPEGGAWTLEVQVTFADGLGTAHYAWALTVS